MNIKPLSRVQLKKEIIEFYQDIFGKDETFVFLGEIPNMLEHGVFIGWSSGKNYCGYHIDNFEEVPK